MSCDKREIAVSAAEMVEIMEKLRAPDGCPWDREQTHGSLKLFLAEECAELMDAIDAGDYDNMREELGDVLLNLVMNAVIADENGVFDFNDVMTELNRKLIRRHPHVFGNVVAENPEEVKKVWDEIKKDEKENAEPKSILDGVPRNLSALLWSEKIQRKAAKYGFDWECQEQILDKILEEVEELQDALRSGDEAEIDAEIGDLLFSVVNLARFRKRRTSEELLGGTIRKFTVRFKYIESELKKRNIDLKDAGIDLMEKLWQEAKTK